MAFYRASIGGGGGGGSLIQTGTYTSNTSTAVDVPLPFSPSRVIVYQNMNASSSAFVAVSESKGAFYGWGMNGSTATKSIGTFTWSGNTFSHKARAGYGGQTAYYIAIG